MGSIHFVGKGGWILQDGMLLRLASSPTRERHGPLLLFKSESFILNTKQDEKAKAGEYEEFVSSIKYEFDKKDLKWLRYHKMGGKQREI